MSKDKDDDKGIPEYLSAADMRDWLSQEIRNATKALELRVRDATDFVTAYSAGELTPEQADERQWRYLHRWGEALPGAMAGDHVTDKQILDRIDASQGEYSSPRELEEHFRERFGPAAGRKPKDPEQSR